MGFWNAIIYAMTSRAACKKLILGLFARRRQSRAGGAAAQERDHRSSSRLGGGYHGNRRSAQRVSWGDDFERLKGERGDAEV